MAGRAVTAADRNQPTGSDHQPEKRPDRKQPGLKSFGRGCLKRHRLNARYRRFVQVRKGHSWLHILQEPGKAIYMVENMMIFDTLLVATKAIR
ncbi:hypothetical protein [Pontixanthobacter sp.]|uniref:hypothetical protein n=1 Tax=Pontixanthobacter sp. TaxID=2792078 RepID=UPI003C797531